MDTFADHLYSSTKECNNKWKYPSIEDILMGEFEQMSSAKLNWIGM